LTNKLYMENPYLREIESIIINKQYKNNQYHITLDRTIFYPHLSGGQPRDRGTINNIEVVDVYENGDDIVHVINKDINSKYVKIAIDWNNRFDLMQQHSGQHLLSSSFYRLFNAKTIGFRIGEEYAYIDIEKSSLTDGEISQIEYLSNKIIQSNFMIKSYFVTNAELSKVSLRQSPPNLQYTRIIEIDGIDTVACGGTHVNNTGEIALVKIRKWRHYKGSIRIEFICGNRAIKDYTWKSKYINEISLLLSSRDKDAFKKTKLLFENNQNLEKENKLLRQDLYKYKGELLMNKSRSFNKINYIVHKFTNTSLKEIKLIAYNLNNQPGLIQIYGNSNLETGQFLLARSKDLNINLKYMLQGISRNMKIKGGGSPQTIQGKVDLKELDLFMDMFYKEIRSHYKA